MKADRPATPEDDPEQRSAELVYVVPRAVLPGGAGWRGILVDDVDACLEAMARHGRYEPREAMERDPDHKQVIPYVVLRDGRRVFLMRRTRAGGDARLHERFSIGVGGHLNPGDAGLAGGLLREWGEELEADFVPEFRVLGLLNDDTTEVGAVHIGVVYVADADGRPVNVRETDKLSGEFVEPAELLAVYDRMETWSQLVHDLLSNRAAPAKVEFGG